MDETDVAGLKLLSQLGVWAGWLAGWLASGGGFNILPTPAHRNLRQVSRFGESARHFSACRTAVGMPQMTHGGGSLPQRALAVKALMLRRSIVRARQAARAA
eukprot:891860-Prymnesium_polylepis.2